MSRTFLVRTEARGTSGAIEPGLACRIADPLWLLGRQWQLGELLGTDAGRNAPFVLAPLTEQKRIADRLDALLVRVDACRERLDRVPSVLKRFRQSVLAAATNGELTREWRELSGYTPAEWLRSEFPFLQDLTGVEEASSLP